MKLPKKSKLRYWFVDGEINPPKRKRKK